MTITLYGLKREIGKKKKKLNKYYFMKENKYF